MEVLVVNEPIPVVVYHVECLLKFLNLVLVEHGKYITGGSLEDKKCVPNNAL